MTDTILYNRGEDEWYFADESIEEIAQQALNEMTEAEFTELGYVTIYKGVQKTQHFKSYFKVEDLLESINEYAYNECGEFAEDYLQALPQEIIDDLESVVCKWADKHKLNPTWFMVEDVVEVKVYPVDKNDIGKGYHVEWSL